MIRVEVILLIILCIILFQISVNFPALCFKFCALFYDYVLTALLKYISLFSVHGLLKHLVLFPDYLSGIMLDYMHYAENYSSITNMAS